MSIVQPLRLDDATWPMISQSNSIRREVLLHARRRMGLLEIGGDIVRTDRRQRQVAIFAPGEENRARAYA